MTPLIAASSRQSIERLKSSPPHAMLLMGPKGVGLLTIASWIADQDQVLTITPQLLTKTSTIPQISIDMIRELYESTRSRSHQKQIVIIDDADAMSIGAQNAFLKLLEEPPKNVHFILTSHYSQQLLPTIRSRTQIIQIPRLSDDELHAISNQLDPARRSQIRFIAGGLPAEMRRLQDDEAYFEKAANDTRTAKTLLESRGYDTIRIIHKISSKRSDILPILERLLFLLQLSPTPSSVKRIDAVAQAYDACLIGSNPKLQLLRSMIQ